MRCHGKEQLVRDGVLVVPVFAPPNAPAAGGVPCARHISEDGLSHREIALVPGKVIRIDPGERPPSLIVVIVVQETRCAAHAFKWTGLLRLGNRDLRAVEGVGEHGQVAFRAAPAYVVDQDGGRVGCVPPPRGLVEPSALHIPALQCLHSKRDAMDAFLVRGGCRGTLSDARNRGDQVEEDKEECLLQLHVSLLYQNLETVRQFADRVLLLDHGSPFKPGLIVSSAGGIPLSRRHLR